MEQSKLLQELLLYATALEGNAQDNRSVERILLALLVAVFDNNFTSSEFETLKPLVEMLADRGYNPPKLMFDLKEYVKNSEKPVIDKLHYDIVMTNAKHIAENNAEKEITTKDFVQSVLMFPVSVMQTHLNNQKTKDTKTVEPLHEKPVYHVTNDDTDNGVEALLQTAKEIREKLSLQVKGQDHAIDVLISGFFRSEFRKKIATKQDGPGAIFLFAGPPGVGKTLLASKVAETLGRPFCRFDMSGYNFREAALEFCGSDAVYKDSKKGNFTEYVEKNPNAVILLDEFEKAHISIVLLFLQALDRGSIRDSQTDEEISLRNTILIFTTNAGKQLYQDVEFGDFSNVSRKVILNALRKDINPETREPYFPEAICSRFATGNVVMFNHIQPATMIAIAKSKLLENTEKLTEEFDINVTVDEDIYSAILLAEGGKADARIITSRTDNFFFSELYELLRLAEKKTPSVSLKDIDNIAISAILPDDEEVRTLLRNVEEEQGLIFSDAKTAKKIKPIKDVVKFMHTDDVEEAKTILKKNEIGFVLLDITCGVNTEQEYMNFEDVDSASRDFLKYLRTYCAEIPVYILQNDKRELDSQEKLSYKSQGIRDFVAISDSVEQNKVIKNICENINYQRSMKHLARANKVISYETAQSWDDTTKTAHITLFDFKLVPAVDGEDAGDILNDVSKPDVKFSAVIGAEDAQEELKYYCKFLKNPRKYIGTGVKTPKGILLYGPPGTGKTLLAKAMASEAGVTFIAAEGNKFVTKGSDEVHRVFALARKYAPSILFVDEIDTVAKKRGGSSVDIHSDALTAFLTEMDGFNVDASKPVFVLGATNYGVEQTGTCDLDPAILRRFDRRLYVDLPTKAERIRYMKLLASKNDAFDVSDSIIDNLAIRSTGMSLALLESVFDLALRDAIRQDSAKVTDAILEEAFESFNSGEKKEWDIKSLEKTARHEAGHAFVCWKNGETPSYLTIVARGDHGGYMQHGDHEQKGSYTKADLLARIRVSLAGRAAEIVYYGDEEGYSSGASADLANATNIAQSMICQLGMGKDGLAVLNPNSFLSAALSEKIYGEINAILSRELLNATAIIRDNKKSVDALVCALLEKNRLTAEEMEEILSNIDE